jgi:type IV pilus assembly protein PilN
MIKINLLGVERKVVAKRVSTPRSGQPVLIGAAVILLLCASGVGWRYWVLTNDSRRLDEEMAAAEQEEIQLQRVIAQVAQFEQRKVLLQQRVTLIEQLRSNQTGPVHMLDQISRSLPPMVWLTELKQTAQANEVVIAGRCTALTGLSDFVSNLEASGYFKKSIEIVSSTTEPLATPPGELVKFEIRALFQQPAAGRPDPAAAPPAASGVRSND